MNKFYSFIVLLLCSIATNFLSFSAINAQIEYNWQNSKEGWISGGDCNLTAQPDAMAMRLFSPNGKMISGTLSANLGISGGDYNKVDITVKNPTSGSGIARLFIYPPGAANNNDTCYYAFQVDTSMTSFATYTVDLDSVPTGGVNTVYTGPIARFGLRAPWGGANFDTIFWEKMVVYNTNQPNDSVVVTFNVDMSQVSDPFTTPELNGDFNAWGAGGSMPNNAMNSPTANSIYTIDMSFIGGEQIEYKFSADNWSISETLDPQDPCTNGSSSFTNRALTVPFSDTILPAVCWGSCDPCLSSVASSSIQFLIYPNPSSSELTINTTSSIQRILLKDIFGKIILNTAPNSYNFILNTSDFSSNLYFIECLIDGSWHKRKIIISH